MYDAFTEKSWRVAKRKAEDGKNIYCLYVGDVEPFGRHYGFDVPKTQEWVSVCDVVKHFETRNQCKIREKFVRDIFNRLGNPYIPKAGETWRLAARFDKDKGYNPLCIHVSELQRLGARYNLDVPAKPEDWLSTDEMCQRLYGKGTGKIRFDRVLSRLQPTPDASRMFDPNKGLSWQVRFFIIKGEPRPCLHRDGLESFAACYRGFKSDNAPETPEWLSAQDLGDYLGTSNYQYIEALLDKLGPIKNDVCADGKTEYMIDEAKQWIWRIQILSVNDLFSRCLHQNQIEEFVAKYRLYNLRKKQFKISSSEVHDAIAC